MHDSGIFLRKKKKDKEKEGKTQIAMKGDIYIYITTDLAQKKKVLYQV